jgi:hypothetical protein
LSQQALKQNDINRNPADTQRAVARRTMAIMFNKVLKGPPP